MWASAALAALRRSITGPGKGRTQRRYISRCGRIRWWVNHRAEIHKQLMSDRVDFNVVCPNNHDQTVTFSREEFEETLKSGALVFHCNTCGTNWDPSSEEIAKFRKALSKNSS